MTEKTIEEKYKKLNQIEHILKKKFNVFGFIRFFKRKTIYF